jgi:glycosyltransferase involved in cell wall biosynthesis
MHATPIVGYDTGYSSNLIEKDGGGLHVKNGDYIALGEALFELDRKRENLVRLIQEAELSGQRFSASEVFRYRSELIKKHLAAI